ncbi:MAG: secretion protein HlyD [Ancalomicrobiaceae bacterium]|nr:secretion protein HlyD [Ancalomicrobiaceae bacterium]
MVVAAAIGGGTWWWQHQPETGGDLTLQGNVEVRQVNLGFKVAGRIKALDVDEGAAVAQGQRLAELDPVYFQDSITQLQAQCDQLKANLAKMQAGNRPEEIAQAEATVAERQAALDNTKLAFDRANSLMQTATGTRKAYDDAVASRAQAAAQLNSARQGLILMQAGFRKEDIEAARAQLDGGEAQLKIAERQLADASLYAPSAGTILTRVRETGAIVNAGETVFVESLTSPVWIRTYVSETELGRIHPGEEVAIKTDTPGMPVIKGRVGFISSTAEFTPKTVETRELRTALVYRLRIVAEDPQGVLRQGMPVTVTAASAAKQPLQTPVKGQHR